MTTAWGVPDLRDTDGTIIDATTPDDVQIITNAKYDNPGIITGAKVFTRADMKVNITNGAVVMKWGQDRAVEVPVYAQTITLDPAPPTGSTTVTFYVQQANTSTSRAASVVMTTGTAPSGTVVLDQLRVPAGATKSSACESVWDRQYARLTQSSQGVVSRQTDTDDAIHAAGKQYKRCAQRLFVDTDRWLNLKVSTSISRVHSSGSIPPNDIAMTLGTVMYRVYVDDELVAGFERPFNRFWSVEQFEVLHKVTMGAHTAHIVSELQWDEAVGSTYRYWRVRYGGPDKRTGDVLTVFDAGVAV